MVRTDDTPIPAATIAHRLPDRTRLRIAEKRGDEGYFAEAAERLCACTGIHGVAANPRTGSLLIDHEADRLQPILAAARRDGLFRVDAIGSPSARAEGGAADVRAEMLSAASTVFATLGLVQLGRGRIAGNTVEALWNGYGAAATLRQPWLSAALVGLGLYQLLNGQFLGSAASLFFYSASARHLSRASGGAAST